MLFRARECPVRSVGKFVGNPLAHLDSPERVACEGGLRLGLAIVLAGQTRGQPCGILSEITLRRVLHVPECHVRGGVTQELLQPHDRHASLCAVDTERVAEVVNRRIRLRHTGGVPAAVVELGS
jgi:hypothetical protein